MDIIAESLRIPMRDGVELSVHVYRPAGGGPVPAVLSYHPYRKGPLAADHPLVAHGYAVVQFDVRGTGDSAGWNDSVYCDAERQDGYDMVEWTAGQPWCTGSVGMVGISYGAVVALQMAGLAPPHLKAIIARSGSDDPWAEWTTPGGAPRTYIFENYATIMACFNFAPPDRDAVGERWDALWAERLERNMPWGIAFLEHLQDGPFWRARSLRGHYDDVRCAVYVVDGWADWYPTPLLRIFAGLDVPKRALIGPWSHLFPDIALPGPRIDWTREMVRWFDHWLKGVDTGIMAEPPVTLFVREFSTPARLLIEDAGRFRAAEAWPPAPVRETALYLRANGGLTETPEPDRDSVDILGMDPRAGIATGKHGGGPYNTNWMMPLDQRADEVHAQVYTTAPYPQGLEIIGVPRLCLHVEASAPTGLLAVKLCDVAPDDTAALITKGFLNLAYRDPAHPQPLLPGEVVAVELTLLACAYRLRPGHRLRVMVAAADFLNIWPTPHADSLRLHRCAAYPSQVILPVMPADAPVLPLPDLRPSPVPLPERATLEAPLVEINRNLFAGTQTLHYEARYGDMEHSARTTVSEDDPAVVVIDADARLILDDPGGVIIVETRCTTTSDANTFSHEVDVDITVDAEPYFHKHWSRTVGRELM
jgi:putative CocE/NonD family hydrolase